MQWITTVGMLHINCYLAACIVLKNVIPINVIGQSLSWVFSLAVKIIFHSACVVLKNVIRRDESDLKMSYFLLAG